MSLAIGGSGGSGASLVLAAAAAFGLPFVTTLVHAEIRAKIEPAAAALKPCIDHALQIDSLYGRGQLLCFREVLYYGFTAACLSHQDPPLP